MSATWWSVGRLIECGDPLVDVAAVGSLLVAAGTPKGAGPFLRSPLVDRLVTAQALLPPGVRLQVVAGYRPGVDGQRRAGRYAARTGVFPAARGADRSGRRTGGDDPRCAESHGTGAAVDLTLCDLAGDPLWLGTEVHAPPESCDRACYTASPYVPPEPRARRLLLVQALTALNLVNHPSAWWHWSYGDRYWAQVSGARLARYGPLPPAQSPGRSTTLE